MPAVVAAPAQYGCRHRRPDLRARGMPSTATGRYGDALYILISGILKVFGLTREPKRPPCGC